MSFERSYSTWRYLHSGVVIALLLAAEVPVMRVPAATLLAAWTAAAFLVLFLAIGRRHPDGSGRALPNILTGIRLLGAVALPVVLVVSTIDPAFGGLLRRGGGYVLVGFLAVVELTDYFDGLLARKYEHGAFGAVWDMQTDAIFAAALTVVARHVVGVAAFVLIIGLLPYVYSLVWLPYYGRMRRASEQVMNRRLEPRKSGVQRWYEKTTTAVLVVTLIIVLAPALPLLLRESALVVALALQLFSFGWDIAVQFQSIRRRSEVA